MKRRRAVIVGGSIGGLFAGNMLVQQGWKVDILERAKDDLSSRETSVFLQISQPDTQASARD